MHHTARSQQRQRTAAAHRGVVGRTEPQLACFLAPLAPHIHLWAPVLDPLWLKAQWVEEIRRQHASRVAGGQLGILEIRSPAAELRMMGCV